MPKAPCWLCVHCPAGQHSFRCTKTFKYVRSADVPRFCGHYEKMPMPDPVQESTLALDLFFDLLGR